MKSTKYETIIPESSVIIDGILSEMIHKNELQVDKILISATLIKKLEFELNENKESGFLGLKELEILKTIEKEKNEFELIFIEDKIPTRVLKEMNFFEINQSIREIAYENGAILFTVDETSEKIARAYGLQCELIQIKKKKTKIQLEKFFDETTMSVHIKEDLPVYAKKGKPGEWEFVQVTQKNISQKEIKTMIREIIEETNRRQNSFVELDRPGSTIIQLENYRIVFTKTPFSDAYEITAVRPVKKLNMEDYNLSEKLIDRIEHSAEGILIAGSPGMGKSTFAQALAEFYAKKEKIVKTVEAPRDLQLPQNITQYAISHGSSQEVHDVLLLSRPDYTLFDEMRNTEDFELFADMRLAGVGMVGIVHATAPVDAIQRFIGRIELGVIPQIIDTILFVKDGQIKQVYSLSMTVKVPSGMTEADLARPIVVVNDFETGKLVYEIYTYGEETVVIPVSMTQKKETAVQKMVKDSISEYLSRFARNPEIEFVSDNKIIVYITKDEKPKFIGREGSNINKIEKDLGLSIDVRLKSERQAEEKEHFGESVFYEVDEDNSGITFKTSAFDTDVDVIVEGDILMTATTSKSGKLKVKRKNRIGKILSKAIKNEEPIILKKIEKNN